MKENWDELPNTPSPVVGASAVDLVEPEMDDLSAAGSVASSASAGRISHHLETERSLPGIVMASGGHVFSMLYQLSEVDDLK